jgi:hypothetical protein
LKLLTTIKPQRWKRWEPHATRSRKYESNDFWTCSAIVLEYWVIFSLKIKLNHSWKFQRNWNMPLVLLERSWWAGFNGIYLVRFGFRMWEILIVKWFLPLKIQINSKKPGFGREKSVENVVTLEGLPFNSSIISFHIWLFKKINTYIAKQCSHVEFPYFVMGVHTWAKNTGHTIHIIIWLAIWWFVNDVMVRKWL